MDLQKVCRACLQLIACMEPNIQNEGLIEAFQEFIPDSQVTFPDLFFCGKCATFLRQYRNFKQMCLVTEDKIKSYFCVHSCGENATLLDVLSECNKEAVIKTEVLVEDLDPEFEGEPIKEEFIWSGPENEADVEQEFSCENCNLSFATQDLLLQHTACCDVKNNNKNKRETQKTFECQHCNFTTNYSVNMRRHTKTKHTGDLELHSCEFCDYKTMNRYNLKTHVNSQHTKETNYPCKLCSFSTFRRSSLIEHIKSHKTGKSFTCQLCNQTFLKKQAHSEHLLKKHDVKLRSGGEAKECSLCSYVTYSNAFFRRHWNTVHETRTEYKCEQCDYRTGDWSHLKRHQVKHQKKKSFKCESCDFSCKLRSYLSAHILKHHPEALEGN